MAGTTKGAAIGTGDQVMDACPARVTQDPCEQLEVHSQGSGAALGGLQAAGV